jgi:hypothetical protein
VNSWRSLNYERQAQMTGVGKTLAAAVHEREASCRLGRFSSFVLQPREIAMV